MQAKTATVTEVRYLPGLSFPHSPGYLGRGEWQRDTIPAQYWLYYTDENGSSQRSDLRNFFKKRWGIFTARRRAALQATMPQTISVDGTEISEADLVAWLRRAQDWLDNKPKGWKPEPPKPPREQPEPEVKPTCATTERRPAPKQTRLRGAKATCTCCGKLKRKTAFRKGMKGKLCKSCERI